MSDLPLHGKVYGRNLWKSRNGRLPDMHFPFRCSPRDEMDDDEWREEHC
jgi:hypothetical protein